MDGPYASTIFTRYSSELTKILLPQITRNGPSINHVPLVHGLATKDGTLEAQNL